MNADERPADFAAFLFAKHEESIEAAIKAVDNVKSKDMVAPQELRDNLKELLN
jgi:hypothetical protein